jgi:hypothetical protein
MTGIPAAMCVWKGMAMDSLKFQTGPSCPTFLCLAGGPPLKQPYSCFRGGPQCRQSAAVFHRFRHPMPYAYVNFCQFNNKEPTWLVCSRAKSKIMVKKLAGSGQDLGSKNKLFIFQLPCLFTFHKHE